MDWNMILKMSVSVLLYVLVTAVLIRLYRDIKPLTTGLKILIGLVFGICSAVASHLGTQYPNMPILHVRDIGPLCAGLLFSPLSGIIAGFIGGGERLLAGGLLNYVQLTAVAGSLSTFLAGCLAAFLNKWIYKGNRPSVPRAFLLGALMEVFHMYSGFFVNKSTVTWTYSVIRLTAVPMITFTAAGLALCTATVKIISGEKLRIWVRTPWKQVPISIQIQRWLLTATIVLFLLNFAGSYQFQRRMMIENESAEVASVGQGLQSEYELTHDIDDVIIYIDNQYDTTSSSLLVNLNSGLIHFDEYDIPTKEPVYCDPKSLEIIREHLNQSPFVETNASGSSIIHVVSIGEEYAVMTTRNLQHTINILESVIYENTLSDILLFAVFYFIMSFLADRLVVKSLKRVQVSLDGIINGHLEEQVDVRSSPEFSSLSDNINGTVTALKGYIDEAEKRMEQDLALAAEIQDSALPKNFNLPTESVELHALMTPAKQVGGDFYDFFFISPDQLCLVIADVSGKSVPAALFMMRSKTAIKGFARDRQGPAELLGNVNRALCDGNDTHMFVTVWLGILDLNTGLMRCCNAGHEYPAVRRAGGDYELLTDEHGKLLGIFKDISLAEYEIQLNPGDRLFVYTDGVPEAADENRKQYGTGRMTEQLNRLKDSDQKTILEGVLQDIRKYAGAADQFDDITMLGLTYKGEKGLR